MFDADDICTRTDVMYTYSDVGYWMAYRVTMKRTRTGMLFLRIFVKLSPCVANNKETPKNATCTRRCNRQSKNILTLWRDERKSIHTYTHLHTQKRICNILYINIYTQVTDKATLLIETLDYFKSSTKSNRFVDNCRLYTCSSSTEMVEDIAWQR